MLRAPLREVRQSDPLELRCKAMPPGRLNAAIRWPL
jgi:hypothetical protein